MSEWARPGELDVFPTGTTTVVDADADARLPHAADALRRTGTAVAELRARPGYRLGDVPPPASGRRGGDTDVVRPVLVRPVLASSAATSGRLFREPFAGLELCDPTGGDDRRFLVWQARLSGEHVTAVPVSLRLLGTPSMVVTVIELVPQRRLRWNRTGFVADGIDAVELVARRLARLCAD